MSLPDDDIRIQHMLDSAKEALSLILAKAGVDPHARPETLNLHQFASIANAVSG